MRAILLLTAAMAIAPGAASATPIGCSLISPSEIETATGIPVAPGIARIRSATLVSCSFAAERGGEIQVLVRRAPTRQWISGQIARMQQGAYREVPGIGERSFLYTLPDVAVVCVFRSDSYLQISVSGLRERAPSRAALALAKADPLRDPRLCRGGASNRKASGSAGGSVTYHPNNRNRTEYLTPTK